MRCVGRIFRGLRREKKHLSATTIVESLRIPPCTSARPSAGPLLCVGLQLVGAFASSL